MFTGAKALYMSSDIRSSYLPSDEQAIDINPDIFGQDLETTLQEESSSTCSDGWLPVGKVSKWIHILIFISHYVFLYTNICEGM